MADGQAGGVGLLLQPARSVCVSPGAFFVVDCDDTATECAMEVKGSAHFQGLKTPPCWVAV